MVSGLGSGARIHFGLEVSSLASLQDLDGREVPWEAKTVAPIACFIRPAKGCCFCILQLLNADTDRQFANEKKECSRDGKDTFWSVKDRRETYPIHTIDKTPEKTAQWLTRCSLGLYGP